MERIEATILNDGGEIFVSIDKTGWGIKHNEIVLHRLDICDVFEYLEGVGVIASGKEQIWASMLAMLSIIPINGVVTQ